MKIKAVLLINPIVSTSVQLSHKLSKLTQIHSEVKALRKAINNAMEVTDNEDENHYYLKIKDIIEDVLSINDYDPKSYDLLRFISKDIMVLYDTCDASANVMLYIERIADFTDSLMEEIERFRFKENSPTSPVSLVYESGKFL